MRETNIDIAGYLGLYERKWAALFEGDHSFPLKDYPGRSILSTWTLSYEQVQQRHPDASYMLQLWSCLDHTDLWYELFTPTLQKFDLSLGKLPKWFTRSVSDELHFRQTVRVLLNYSLAESQIASGAYSMHPVVHDWCHHQQIENRASMTVLAAAVVGSTVPASSDREYWVLEQRLLLHANRVYGLIQSGFTVDPNNMDGNGLFDACSNLGRLYRHQGKLKEAEEMYQQALKGREKALGLEHRSTLHTVNNLGLLYMDQGKLKEAEEMYQRALKGKEKALGLEHRSTLHTVNNLGILYKHQGKLKEAEEMYQRALKGSEKALGLEHTSTLLTVNNLGVLYRDQGKLKEAEEMFQRALKGREKALGLEHTSTLNTVNNLGSLYREQGKLKEAEGMFQRALKGREKALGLEHTSTLNTVNNLGNLHMDQGKLKEAEEMFQRASKGYGKPTQSRSAKCQGAYRSRCSC